MRTRDTCSWSLRILPARREGCSVKRDVQDQTRLTIWGEVRMNRGVIGAIIGVLVIIILVLVILRMT